MRKLVNLLVRQDGLSHEAFVDFWLNEHAPLAESLPGVRKYTTSVPADPKKAAYDGIAELDLDADTTVRDEFASDAGQQVQADTANYVNDDAGEILVVDESVPFGDDGMQPHE